MKNDQGHPLYNIQAILQDGFRFWLAFYQSSLLHRILIEYVPSVSSMKHWSLGFYREYEAVCIWYWYWCHILSRALQYQMKRSFACGAKVSENDQGQLTDFYMMETLAFNELITLFSN